MKKIGILFFGLSVFVVALFFLQAEDLIAPEEEHIEVAEETCDITITSPKASDRVGTSVDVAGSASVCWDWAMVNILDSNKNILSSFGLTLDNVDEAGLSPFFIPMELRASPQTEKGSLQFLGAHNEYMEIPVRFDPTIVGDSDL
ncbi:hypothetical protein C0581_04355 [Candidatus Parcubacteria bacterium]|nr:MAG: hypothetical protein C0581_04355 [Candidatus Parcubacteria bacterium]